MSKVKEITKKKQKLKPPKLYKVFMHNDNYTTMDFVVEVLKAVFNKSPEESERIMLTIHNEGLGLCGVYPYDIATSKTELVHFLAEKNKFPLKCSVEPEQEI
jgi:ATP-dependent Clp protease adaptor protein ClpS